MTLNSKVIISDTLFLQEIDDETILLDTATQEYFSLNEVGKIIWKIMTEKKDLILVKDEILLKYNIDEKEVKKDIINFLLALEKKGLIEIV